MIKAPWEPIRFSPEVLPGCTYSGEVRPTDEDPRVRVTLEVAEEIARALGHRNQARRRAGTAEGRQVLWDQNAMIWHDPASGKCWRITPQEGYYLLGSRELGNLRYSAVHQATLGVFELRAHCDPDQPTAYVAEGSGVHIGIYEETDLRGRRRVRVAIGHHDTFPEPPVIEVEADNLEGGFTLTPLPLD